MDDRAALVLLSGGQDSATCLAWALGRFERVETVGFAYGQRHAAELELRTGFVESLRADFPAWADRLGPDHLIDLSVLGAISETALTRDVEIAMGEGGLPNTFVPGRNLIFLSFAAALGYRRGTRHIVTGVCETDYSGYPDCRDDTVKALQVAFNLGMDRRFVLHTPLMWLDKAETWSLAEQLGGERLIELIRERTLSCYKGDTETRNEWGAGCGACPACELRAAGYARFKESRAACGSVS